MEQILSFMIDNHQKKSLATAEINFEFSLKNWFSDVPLYALEIALVVQDELQRCFEAWFSAEKVTLT